jgi:hypothetical protein
MYMRQDTWLLGPQAAPRRRCGVGDVDCSTGVCFSNDFSTSPAGSTALVPYGTMQSGFDNLPLTTLPDFWSTVGINPNAIAPAAGGSPASSTTLAVSTNSYLAVAAVVIGLFAFAAAAGKR